MMERLFLFSLQLAGMTGDFNMLLLRFHLKAPATSLYDIFNNSNSLVQIVRNLILVFNHNDHINVNYSLGYRDFPVLDDWVVIHG